MNVRVGPYWAGGEVVLAALAAAALAAAPLAASVMTSATFSGSCSIATWQVGNLTATPPARFAASSSMAGLNVRSFIEITCHDGFDFQAAWVSFSSNIGPYVCP